jgi:DNA-binding MarR family transcriptional regulator
MMSIIMYDRVVAQDRVGHDLWSSTGYLLSLAGAQSRRRWAHMLAGHGLTPHHYGVLMAADHLGGASQHQLSGAVGLDPRNAVRVIDVLEERKLIHRRPDRNDRRRHVITLTAAGRTLMGQLRREGDAVERRMLDCLAPDERETLHGLLHKLLTALRDPEA